MSILVSVIIPYYNKKDTINRSVESVLNQTYTNWELIIVDDKSEVPLEVKEDWNSPQKIICIKNEDNLGPGLTRQRGLDIARGEFICFLDSDDYWLPDFLSECLKLHLDNRSLCATYSQSKMIDGSLRRRNNIEDAQDDLFYAVVSGVRPWATCALMWKRKYLSKWSAIRTNEDALFELETAFNNPRILMVPKILCVIDKESGNNSEDLVKKAQIEKNRNFVLRFAAKNLHLYGGLNHVSLKKIIWLRLKVLTIKQFKYKNYFEGMVNIIILVRRFNWSF